VPTVIVAILNPVDVQLDIDSRHENYFHARSVLAAFHSRGLDETSYPPYRVAYVIRNQQRSTEIYGNAHRPAHCVS
jgi:hypothetical protein